MPVKQDLDDALKAAMKAKDSAALEAVRSVKSAVKMAEIESGKELDDAGVHAVIQKAVKQRRDSIEQFKAGNRGDLVAVEEAQAAVLLKFLPQQMDAAAVAVLVEEAVAATGASGPRDMGKVMAWLMPKAKGRADGGALSQAVKARLG